MCEFVERKYTSACERFPPDAGLGRRREDEYLIYAVEVRALKGGLNEQRAVVFCGNGHLYFQRTLPSLVSSKTTPESSNFLRISSARLKSRFFFAALRSSTRASISSAERRGEALS